MAAPGEETTSSGRAGEGEQHLRLFVAIELSEDWRRALGELQAAMQEALAGDPRTRGLRVRWARPEAIHLTLKFLGQVDASRLEAIERALAAAVPVVPAFELRLAGAGSFSDRRAPRVIWVGVDPGGRIDRSPLGQLAERVETWLNAAGFPRERRGFSPHLTLARLPEELTAPQRELIAALTCGVAAGAAAPLRVEGVSLMRSHLGPGGARYERLRSYPA